MALAPLRQRTMSLLENVTATIAASGSLSAEVNLGGLRLFGIYMPAAWTAAVLTFQASPDGTNWYDVYDKDGNEVTAQAAASRFVSLDPVVFAAAAYIKVRSGTSGTPVVQSAERALSLALRVI